MAGKKDAKSKASPCDRTEKSKGKNSEGTKSTPGGSGQRTARGTQQQPLQEQAGMNPGEDARSQMEDIKDGWELMKEIDKVLNHLEGRLDRMTAVIRRTSMQDRLQVPAVTAEGAGGEEAKDSREDFGIGRQPDPA